MPDSTAKHADFTAQLAALSQQYTIQLNRTLDDLINCVAGQGKYISHVILADLHARLHKLAGSGGTFGYPELSRQAHALEVIAEHWLKDETTPPPSEWAEWKDGLLALRQTLSSSTTAPLLSRMDLAPVPHQPFERQARIVLIEDDPAIAESLHWGLKQFGYEVTCYPNLNLAESAILANPPDVLVVEITLSGQTSPNSVEAIHALFAQLGHRLPLIFFTAQMDFFVRLMAARAGGDAFLLKPVDAPSLARHIEVLLRERKLAPYRVLIVDDDEELAEHYRLVLMDAGILAETVYQPLAVLEAMRHLRPDLVLMDLYMPEYTGADLARAIRYEEGWQGLPIIYLSAEDNLDRQIVALGSGADDFLCKPISDTRLIATVRTRAARARTVTELMHQDSLTGLLKHASIKERLKQELERARREGTPLAVAMVDIDHFKKVNDTWGHPVGDQVIMTLGHLLRQHLRRSDSIARYGGEEFAAILPGCSEEYALHLLEDIRKRFSEVRFTHGGESFSVTLSAGIAWRNQNTESSDLLTVADAALYVAKRNGRNQIRLAATEIGSI